MSLQWSWLLCIYTGLLSSNFPVIKCLLRVTLRLVLLGSGLDLGRSSNRSPGFSWLPLFGLLLIWWWMLVACCKLVVLLTCIEKRCLLGGHCGSNRGGVVLSLCQHVIVECLVIARHVATLLTHHWIVHLLPLVVQLSLLERQEGHLLLNTLLEVVLIEHIQSLLLVHNNLVLSLDLPVDLRVLLSIDQTWKVLRTWSVFLETWLR